MGNGNLRKLLVVGAHAVLFHRKPHTDPLRMWAKRLLEKKPFKLVAVALANKMGAHRVRDHARQDGLSGNSGVRSVARVRSRRLAKSSAAEESYEGDQEVMRRKAD